MTDEKKKRVEKNSSGTSNNLSHQGYKNLKFFNMHYEF